MTERGLFEPDVLITDQFAAASRRRTTLSSEKRLMLAVLESALDDYRRYIVATDRIGRALFAEAVEWIESPSNEHIFSFQNITETLDINPAYFRRGLAAWHKRLLDAASRAAEVAAAEAQEPVSVAS